MNSDTTLTVGFLVLIVGFLMNVYSFIKSNKHDVNAENFIKVNLKLDELCRGISDIKDDIRAIDSDVKHMRELQIEHEQQIKAIWRQIDELKKK